MSDEAPKPAVPAALDEVKKAVEADVKKEDAKVVAAADAKVQSLWQRFLAWLAKA